MLIFDRFDIELIKACEGRKLPESTQRELGYPEFQKRYEDFGTLPAFGCSISHKIIYNEIVAKNYDLAIVLEDDAILHPDFQPVVEAIKELFSTLDNPTVVLLTPDFFYQHNDNRIDLKPTYKLVNVLSGYMTSGYIINKKGAKLLYDIQSRTVHLADAWNEFIKMGLNLKGVLPHIVSFPDGIGEIGESQLRKEESLIKKMRHVLGRIKAYITKFNNHIKGIRQSKKKWT